MRWTTLVERCFFSPSVASITTLAAAQKSGIQTFSRVLTPRARLLVRKVPVPHVRTHGSTACVGVPCFILGRKMTMRDNRKNDIGEIQSDASQSAGVEPRGNDSQHTSHIPQHLFDGYSQLFAQSVDINYATVSIHSTSLSQLHLRFQGYTTTSFRKLSERTKPCAPLPSTVVLATCLRGHRLQRARHLLVPPGGR